MKVKLKLGSMRNDGMVLIRRSKGREYWGTPAQREACLKAERSRYLTALRYSQHGGAYVCWRAMTQRCSNANRPDFSRYGGAGITVCDRWKASYSAFIADMGARPSKRHSIDRIDNGKGYEPGNCRWASVHQQNQNRRSTKLKDNLLPDIDRLHQNGQSQRQIAAIYKVSQTAIGRALGRYEQMLAQQTAA